MLWCSVAIISMFAVAFSAEAAEVVLLDQFHEETEQVPAPWQVVQLDKIIAPTRYRVHRWDDVLGIEARADHSMALLARTVEVDLNRKPVLCWRWRVDAPLVKADMAS